jgi:predicted ATPase
MRIAFSGSHRVGKTTLVERIAEALPGYTTVDEPYYLLEADGYEFTEQPSLDNFEAQLERSLAALAGGERDALFDRCPVDVLAYLLVHHEAARFDPDDWRERIHEAMQTLDLVVFVPVEDTDRIALASHDDAEHRSAVHAKLCELLVDDALGLDAEVLAVTGDVRVRVDQIMARIAGLAKGATALRRCSLRPATPG